MGRKIIIKSDTVEIADRYKKELNDEQLKAVIHPSGPSLIIAGAGSGKTRVLTYRVAYLLNNNVPPESIILVTFTKKAAKEMISREEQLVGSKTRGIRAGTFHHIANVELRKYAKIVGLQNNFSVMDPGDQKELIKIAIGKNIEEEDRKRFPAPEDLIEMYSKGINLGKTSKETIEEMYPQYKDDLKDITEVLLDYEALKRKNNLVDYDDLLIFFLDFLNKEGSNAYRKQIRYVLVDEYQDVNTLQSLIIDKLAFDAKSLTVVGDDAQAIYRFRGADFTHMLNFPENNLGCVKYKLEENYRSTPEILNLANASINHNINQFEKNLYTKRPSGEKPMLCSCENQDQEAKLVCQLILDYRDNGIPLNEQSILFRAKYYSLRLEQELIRRNIPFEVRAGLKFFEQKHIKDFLSFLVVINNPSDIIQWMRLFSIHKSVSGKTAQKIVEMFKPEVNQLEQFINMDLINDLKGKRIRKDGIKSLKGLQNFFINNITDVQNLTVLPEDQLGSLVELAKKIINYIKPLIKSNYEKNAEDRINDLNELLNFVNTYNSLSAFLTDVLTQYDLKGESLVEGDELNEEKPIVLSTIHQSKGLEWKCVFLIGLIDGQLPISKSIGNPESIEEERRLFYVGCTRAKDHLILSYPRFSHSSNNFGGGDIISTPSRFIKEIRQNNLMEEVKVENKF